MESPSRSAAAAVLVCAVLGAPLQAQDGRENLLPAGTPTDLPLVRPNDNRTPAGSRVDGVHEIDLDVVRADWRIETPQGPGLRVAAVAESGKLPVVPAPLIRVETGTRLRIRVRNSLGGEAVTVFGLHTRPAEGVDSVVVPAGERRLVEFEPGEPGTYMYWMREGPPPDSGQAPLEREQLVGGLVIDPVGGSPPDRILVMNVFADPVESPDPLGGLIEGLTINGLSWPFTERFEFAVGDTVRWRVVNGTIRPHPMHLHGFYYSVLSKGTATGDTAYAAEDRRLVVTELMRPTSTMTVEWIASRPGTWLFHCHLSFHVGSHVRLPGARDADHEHADSHMAGLVVGIEIAPGPTDLVSRGETRRLQLYVNEYGDRPGYRYGFAVDPDFVADSVTDVPGPLLTFRRHESVEVTVHNRMSVATGVHWHGLELDAWADGVPGWSRSDGKVSPVIEPGGSFTYKLSLMRAGTFIYHSHLDDVDQLTGGLFGPLLVLDEEETYDPATDHIRILGWNTPFPAGIDALDMQAEALEVPGRAVVGERHRFRVINIAPAGQISAWLYRGDERLPIRLLARDGADLPPGQRVEVMALPRLGVGSTADFTWTPTEPGSYEIRIGYNQRANVRQVWEVTAEGADRSR